MPQLKSAFMPDRGVIGVTGPDAAAFLQGIITSDMAQLDHQRAIHSGLLTPQGKILFDFFIIKADGGFLLEAARSLIPALPQRLELYKLRSKVEIADRSPEFTVAALWGGDAEGLEASEAIIAFRDPRLPALGYRMLLTLASDGVPAEIDSKPASRNDYDAHRIALGVPEGGKDYSFGDAFPHEALFDQLSGVSFSKGCFIGQEVVSRMQHRGTARKRIVPVVSQDKLPEPGAEILAGTAVIGSLGSTAGNRGLAMIRLDRAADAKEKGEPLLAGATPIEIQLPSWATFDIAAAAGQA